MPNTILGVVVAVALFGFFASLVQPAATAANTQHLESASQELASLLRFTQSEAQRTGELHGVVFSESQQSFSVRKIDTIVPLRWGDWVYHPLTKQRLEWSVGKHISLKPKQYPFRLDSGGSNIVIFDNWGTPFWNVGSKVLMVQDSTIGLALQSGTREVTLLGTSGRVEVL